MPKTDNASGPPHLSFAAATLRAGVTVCLLLCAACPGGEGAGSNQPPNGSISDPGGEAEQPNEVVPPPGATEPNGTTPAGSQQPNIVVTPNAVLSPNMAASPNVVAAPNPNLRLVGRYVTGDPNGPIMSWPGSKILAGFTGTSLTLNMRAVDQQTYYGIGNVDNYINVSIDGGSPSVLRIPQNVRSFSLATNLAPGNHTVELTKRTEAQIGSLQFLGFTLDAGATMAPGPAPLRRRIEVIGDSGTVGYGVEGNWAATHCSFTPATENAAVAWPSVVGTLLQADVHFTANSGKGLYQNRDTNNDVYFTLPVLWTMTSGDTFAQPAGAAATWNPAGFVADAVVVVVGGNEFAASTPPAGAYNTTAVKFLKALRAAYANAYIFVTISPMLEAPVAGQSSPSHSELGVQYAKAMVSTMADPKVAYLPLALDDGSRGAGCDTHMNVATNKIVGQSVATAIAAKLGWQ